jgi:ADP-ribose pyrophosphatase
METPPPFRVEGSRVAWSCPWYEVRQDDLVLPDGSRIQYHTVVKGDGVWVVPLLDDGRVVMLRAWRHTVQEWCWEVPAGSRKPGAGPEETARAELLEEAGGVAASLEQVARWYTAPGVLGEAGYCFLARGVRLGAPQREPSEVHEVHLVEAETALGWARDGTVADAPSALALLRCEGRIRGRA